MSLQLAIYILLISALVQNAAPVFAQPGNDRERGRPDSLVERQVERQTTQGIERQVDRQVARNIQSQIEQSVRDKTGQQLLDESPKSLPQNANNSRPHTSNAVRPYPLERYYDVALDAQGYLHLVNQRLLLVSQAELLELERQGVSVKNVTLLEGLDQALVELDRHGTAQPANLTSEWQNKEELNHLYFYQARNAPYERADKTGWQPQQAFMIPQVPAGNADLRIGLIDSTVDVKHPSLQRADISITSFIEPGLQSPVEHGTAIASILVGETDRYQGLIVGAKMFAAGAFYRTPSRGDTASVKSILLSLDWLMREKVDVINMSLAGPPNALLEQVLADLARKGVTVVAAAGNGGPGARPAYPAAYPDVIAVTAIDEQWQIFYKANHGTYIDFSAPGVDIAHAKTGGGFGHSSGTSYAVPFVTAAAAYLRNHLPAESLLPVLRASTVDLGEPQHDEVYGYGLINFEDWNPANHQ